MANVCVIGLGRIGLPLALLLAKANHMVVGVDANSIYLNNLANKKLSWKNSDIERSLLEAHLGKNLTVTGDLRLGISLSDVIFVAIGTSIDPRGNPDLSNLYNLISEICIDPSSLKGRLLVFKSTLPVGTTRKVTMKIEEKTGAKCGKDFFVAFCPERVLGDRAISEMASLPKIIGGMNFQSSEKAASIYETIGGRIVIVESPEFAELVKLVDNAYRQTIFAFANDFSLVAREYKINAFDLIRTANESYPRNNIPLPSSGVSGYCLTKDPLYLESSFKDIVERRGFHSVWYAARKTNDYMPLHTANILRDELRACGRNISNAKILVCGVAYKENTDDIRSSHGLEIATILKNEGAQVFLWDPLVDCKNISGFATVDSPFELMESLDAMVFTIKHNDFVNLNHQGTIIDLVAKMRTPVIVDGCGIFLNMSRRMGPHYCGIGI